MKTKQSSISWIGAMALGLAVLLCAGLLGTVGLVRGEETQPGAAAITEYAVSFVQGDTGTTDLFAKTEITREADASGCITLPATFSDTVTVNDLGENRQLDCETFYFEAYDAAKVADGSLWAYTFTGWQIEGTNIRLAGETVLQPGFVIPPEVLEAYASDGSLELKALWGKCYFIRNPYSNMGDAYELITRFYPVETTTNGVTAYSWKETAQFIAVNTNKEGLEPTGAYDRKIVTVDSGESQPASSEEVWNKGNDPQNPVATVDYLYSLLGESGDPYDACDIAMVLTGDLDYVKGEDSKYAFNTALVDETAAATGVSHTAPGTAATGWVDDDGYFYRCNATRYFGENQAAPGLTIKSLQRPQGQIHTFYIKHLDTEGYLKTSLRFDNVLLDARNDKDQNGKDIEQFLGKALGDVLMLEGTGRAGWDGGDAQQFFETTARTQSSSVFFPISDLRVFTCERTVLCGGHFSSLNLCWDNGNITEGRDYRWYIGGSAYAGNAYLGYTSSATKQAVTANLYVTMTDGRVDTMHGGSLSGSATNTGSRTYRIYGDGSKRAPELRILYGGPSAAKLYGNVDILIKGCNKIGDVHGGGRAYTATVYGDINIRMEDSETIGFTSGNSVVARGTIYGGGLYGCCEDDPTTDKTEGNVTLSLSGCTVGGTIYGSGRGNSSITESSDTKYIGIDKKPEDWDTPPTGFPVVNADLSVTTSVHKQLGYADGKSGKASGVIWKTYTRNQFFSMASVNSTDITIHDSVVNTVYGGGTIAVVRGNTAIRVTGNSQVKGDIYGGGDGTEDVQGITLYEPITDPNQYDAPKPLVNGEDADIDGDGGRYQALKVQDAEGNWVEAENANQTLVPGILDKNNTPGSHSGFYTWSNDPSLIADDAATYGIDHDRKLIYTPYDASTAGQVLGSAQVSVSGTATVSGEVYGGGNAGAVLGTTTVEISETPTLTGTIYGGGNAGDVFQSVTVNIQGGTVTGCVYGGGNAGTVGADTLVSITASSFGGSVFGGGNRGAVEGTAHVQASNVAFAPITSGAGVYIYGGGNAASVGAVELTLSDVVIDRPKGNWATAKNQLDGAVFGGGNSGQVLGNIDITMTRVELDALFCGGGNNRAAGVGGNITIKATDLMNATDATGKVTVSGTVVDKTEYSFYGGGYIADVAGSVTIDITDGMFDSLYGGGCSGDVGDINLTLSQGQTPKPAVNSDRNPINDNYFQPFVGWCLRGGGSAGAAKDITLTINGGTLYRNIHAGGSAGIANSTRVIINGGRFENNLFGGGDSGSVLGLCYVEINKLDMPNHGVYGGGDRPQSRVGQTHVVINDENLALTNDNNCIYGGSNRGWVCSGTVSQVLQKTASDSTVYTPVSTEPLLFTGNGSTLVEFKQGTAKWVYGGSNGASSDEFNEPSGQSEFGNIMGDARVIVSGGTITNLYGGNNAAGTIGGSTLGDASAVTGVTIDGGTVEYAFGGNNDAGTINGGTQVNVTAGDVNYIFGGVNKGGTINGGTDLRISGGTVGNVYGGSKDGGTIYGTLQTTLSGGQVTERVFGGGHKAHIAEGTADKVRLILTGTVIADTTSSGETLWAYGGGRQADCMAPIYVEVSGSASVGYLFGGCDAATSKTVEMNLLSGTVIVVWGAGNQVSSLVTGDVRITMEGGTVSDRINGGGNRGNMNGSTYVTMNGGNVVDRINGGGDKSKVGGDTHVTVTGGTVSTVFGGGDSSAAYDAVVEGSTYVNISGGNVNNVYGGGRMINGVVKKNTSVEISGNAKVAQRVYGGGYSGPVEGNSSVTISGNAQVAMQVYGGGNAGAVAGDSAITMEGGTVSRDLFGGGLSASVNNTAITISGGTVGNSVYGGGNKGAVAGDSAITMEGGTVTNSVYGGGNQGAVAGDSAITMEGGTVKRDLFGGGLSASVTNTTITISGGTVGRSVYGGGQEGQVQSTSVTITGDAVSTNVYGGGYNGQVLGNASATISGGTVYKEVCGGGYGAQVDSATLTISGSAKLLGQSNTYIYGGGQGGDVTGDVTVLVNGGTVTPSLFGGGREGGVGGDVSVTVSGGTLSSSLYGGGQQGHVNGTTAVTMDGGMLAGNVYGGGQEGTVSATQVQILDDTSITGSVFGGGEGITATVKGGTNVLVHLNYDFQVSEIPIDTTHITPSGQVHSTLVATASTEYGYIGGSVYGGGDLARVGDGTITTGGDKASNITVAGSVVTVSNGCIAGSVFGGGRGIPQNGVDYNFYMGAVFGYTQVTVNGGLIGGSADSTGNVYGGGEQSRVYTVAGQGKACTVVIEEVADKKIAINGSVFGGGDRGESGESNASVPTVYGDVSVLIQGIKDQKPSNIYFLAGLDGKSIGGGVYGDGNLCLVEGKRQIHLLDFEPGDSTNGMVKTFYSLQRADEAILENSAVVLLGAPDLVEEDDTGFYSINRIGQLTMKSGSVVKLDQVVKYLGGISSDVHGDQRFIHDGTNGQTRTNDAWTSCNYKNGDTTCLEPLTQELIDAYRNETGNHDSDDKNVVCVANGLYLEVLDETGAYGPVTGLFTLQLLYANPGEGGGFVYGSIPKSTGDFICETMSWTFSVKSDVTAENYATLMGENDGLFVRVAGKAFQRPTEFTEGQTYYTRTNTESYMDIIDDTGGMQANDDGYTYYYWYIGGPSVTYDVELTGYIGAANTEFATNTTLPQHDVERAYVLYGVAVNEALAAAVGNSGPLDLVQSRTVSGQEIAIELRLGTQSLGFLAVDANGVWGIQKGDTFLSGYGGSQDKVLVNSLITTPVTTANDRMTWVLHKADTVSSTVSGLEAYVDIDVFESQNGVPDNVTTDGTAMLSYTASVNIVRLTASQSLYHDNLRSYTGVANDSTIHITGNSCFTAEYQTRYVPAAYPGAAGDMVWALTTAKNAYFMSEDGAYFTVDANGRMFNFSEGLATTGWEELRDGSYKLGDEIFSQRYSFSAESIPKNTKITMVDLSGGVPTYYYYICDEAKTYISLDAFKLMGTHTTIDNLAEKPAFMTVYEEQPLSLQTERLLFVFDFEQAADKSTTAAFAGGVQLAHLYQDADIMDYAKQNAAGIYERSYPKIIDYQFHGGQTGVASTTYTAAFQDTSYGEKESAVLKVHVEEDENWINTLFRENGFALKIQLLDKDGNAASMPAGMYFEYKGQYYYPGPDSTYTAVPVYEFGDHEITVHNPRFSLMDAVGGDTATFRVSYYSAPDALYYNAFDTKVVKDASYTLTAATVSSLQVVGGPTEDRILNPGEALEFAYTARNGQAGQNVSVTIWKKTEGEYVQADWDSVFDGVSQSLTATESLACSWTLQDTVPAGTYRLIFTFGEGTEYLNLIVK